MELTAFILDPFREERERTADVLTKIFNKVFDFEDENQMLNTLSEYKPTLILTELNLKDSDGIEVTSKIRENKTNQDIVIVIYSKDKNPYIQIEALKSGADDYFDKNMTYRLLLAKLEAFKRRLLKDEQRPLFDSGESRIYLDYEKMLVLINDRKIELKKKEFELINLLLSKPNKVFSRKEIVLSIWGNDNYINQRTIDVHIRKIRKKCGPHVIKTVKGVGYKLEK